MHLHLDLDEIVVILSDAGETNSFSVVVDRPVAATAASHSHRLADVVRARHIGIVEASGDVAVEPAIIRFLAAGEVDTTWDAAFDEMVCAAATRGWVDAAGRIRAHVVWPKTDELT